MDLQEFLNNKKAKTEAWVAEDPSNRWATYPTTDLAHWAEYGIYTIAQYERYNMESTIWDLYKDVHGIRPRWMNFEAMSDAELEAEYNSLLVELEEENKREAEEQERAVASFEAKLDSLVAMGAGSREKAIQWIIDAEGDDFYDNSYFEYEMGLPYGYLKKVA